MSERGFQDEPISPVEQSPWHSLELDDVLRRLHSDADAGIPEAAAAA